MNQFAVLHIIKYKGDLSGIGAHIDRLHLPDNVDPNKVAFNETTDEHSRLPFMSIVTNNTKPEEYSLIRDSFSAPTLTLSEAVWKRIKEGHTVKRIIRKDAVLALGIVLSGSHEQMISIQKDTKLFDAWKKANYNFACEMFGKENIVRFVLHLDEKTPHFHCVVVPITKSGSLSAHTFISGPSKLNVYQDYYAAAMAPFGLARGIPKTLTYRVHILTGNYYQAVQQLIQETTLLTKDIKKSNIFKLDKIREELTENIARLKVTLMEQITKSHYAFITINSLMEKMQARAYQKQLEETSYQAYEWIKKKIPLVPFLTSKLGWKIEETKSNRKEIVLSHPTHSQIIVPKQPKNTTGYWIYFDVNGGEGTLTDLLVAEGWTWKQIKALANNNTVQYIEDIVAHEIYTKAYKTETNPDLQAKQAQMHLDNIVAAREHPFLEQKDISKGIYKNIEGIRVSQQAAAFALYKDFDNTGKGHLCSTIVYYKDRLGNHCQYFQKGLPRGLSIVQENHSLQEATKIIVTQSPIDALSYIQLSLEKEPEWKLVKGDTTSASEVKNHNIEKVAFVSTCGNLTSQTKKDLDRLFELAQKNKQTVVLALNNDITGKKITEELTHMLEELHCTYRIEVPMQEKSWNEVLKEGTYKVNQTDIISNREIVQKQWYIFEEGSYDKSLLKYIGIEENTVKAFEKIIKTNEQAIIIALYGQNTSLEQLTNIWSCKIDKDKEIQEYINLEASPTPAVLKGNIKEAQQIVLVTSPIDALLHYQKEIQSIKSIEESLAETSQKQGQPYTPKGKDETTVEGPKHTEKGPINSKQVDSEHLAKIENICYVYVEPKLKQRLTNELNELLEEVHKNRKTLIIACSKGKENNSWVIEQYLQKQNYAYIKDTMELSVTDQLLKIRKNFRGRGV